LLNNPIGDASPKHHASCFAAPSAAPEYTAASDGTNAPPHSWWAQSTGSAIWYDYAVSGRAALTKCSANAHGSAERSAHFRFTCRIPEHIAAYDDSFFMSS
jgi:hypothetical protein